MVKFWIVAFCVLSWPGTLHTWEQEESYYDDDGYHPREVRSVNDPSYPTGHETDWVQLAKSDIQASIESKLPKIEKAENLILFIGDGMGPSSVTAGRWHKAQRDGTKGYNTMMSWDKWPVTGLAKTYNTNRRTPDSSGTATAFSCGEKARTGTVGVNQHVVRKDCTAVKGNEVKSMMHVAMEEGKWAGIVTTTRMTHATPSVNYAHSADRDWENDNNIPQETKELCPDFKDIAHQLVHEERNLDIRVLLGGGRREFMPNTTVDPEYSDLYGFRGDDLNLIEDWKSKKQTAGAKYQYVDKLSEFNAVDVENTDYLLGLFDHGHMQFEADRADDPFGEPSLEQMVEKAINILKRGPNGYVLLVEGGRIDHAHHDTNAYRANLDTVALETAVAKADTVTSDEDTLVIATADHSHVFTIGGYPFINEDLYAASVETPGDPPKLADDGKPYTALAYANGPGWYNHRNHSIRLDLRDLPPEEQPSTDNKEYLQDAGVPFDSESHGGEDVAVYARGPMAYLFGGTYEQSYIPHAMMYAACIGSNKDHCTKDRVYACPVSQSAHWAPHKCNILYGLFVVMILLAAL